MLRLRKDIPLFPEGRQKAFTLSYDDGISQDKRFIQLLNRYKIKGTFNINSGILGEMDWLTQPGIDVSHYKVEESEIEEIYHGHEIAIHTLTHLSLPHVPVPTATYEIIQDRKNLETICKQPVRGMAYPFGTYDENIVKILRVAGVEYARTINNTKQYELPDEFLKWNPTCHHTDDSLFQLLELFLREQPFSQYSSPQLFFLWGHTYEFEARKQWDMIEEFMKRIYNNNNIWYATNIEIVDYMNGFKDLKYSVTGDYIYNPGRMDLWIAVDGKVYKLPSGKTITIENPNKK